MKRNKKIKITVSTVVHNNEDKVASFLKGLALQNTEYIKIEKVLIFADGSTDNTIDEIRKIADKKVELVIGRKRLGKVKRLNRIFKHTTGDVLVVLDVNAVLKDKFVIENLISPFRYREDVAVVGGNPQPLPPNTFLESAAQNYYQAQELLKKTINEGSNIYGVDRKIFALSRNFIEKARIPDDIENEDAFIYLKCKDENMEFVHQEKAIVWFRLPKNIKDSFSEIKHLTKDTDTIKAKFSKDLIARELSLSRTIRTKVLFYQFVNNPPGYLLFTPHKFARAGTSIIKKFKKKSIFGKSLSYKFSPRLGA